MGQEGIVEEMKTSFTLFLIFFCCFGCGKQSGTPSRSKPLILVSIPPYQFIAERIGGDVLEVQTVAPPGANPHAFEPTSRQTAAIARGEIWFQIGEPFEAKALSVLKGKNQNLMAVDLRQGIGLLQEPSLSCNHCAMDHLDRHIWLSPKLAAGQAETMAHVLSDRFPEHRNLFQKNTEQLRLDLEQLDREIEALLSSVQERVLLVSHPAFSYFCRDYHFEQLSVEYEGKDPRPKQLEEILQKAIAHRAELALALPQYNNKGAQLIAEKLHLPVRMIDPYSTQYFEMMRLLAHMIADPQYQK